jgi:hypothetical protein
MSLLNLLGQTRLLQQNQMSSFPQMQNFSSLQQMMQPGAPPNQLQPPMQQQSPAGGGQTAPKGIVSDKPYVCDICGRGYSYLASLEQHKVRAFCHTRDARLAWFNSSARCLEKRFIQNGAISVSKTGEVT